MRHSGRIISRPPIERMAYISRLLREGQAFTRTTVAAHFDVTSTTIQRDMEFMRDGLNYDLLFSYSTRTWRGQPPKDRIL